MQRASLQTGFFLALLASVLILAARIFYPYLSALMLAAVLAVIFYPLHRMFLRPLGGHESAAALLTTGCIFVIIILPFIFFGWQIFQEAWHVYLEVTDPATAFSSQLTAFVQERLQRVAPGVTVTIDGYLQQFLEWLLQHTGEIFSSTAKVILNIFLSLIALYYLLRDGRKLKQRVMDLSPLADAHDSQIADRLRIAVNSVIKGSLTIAVLQGVVTGFGLALFGVPNAALWGSVTVLAALLPNIGAAAVLTPAVLYLFLTDHIIASAGLLIWGLLAVGLLDDFLGPRLIHRGTHLHPMIILLAVIGGLQLFGPIGYVLGPLVISFLFALLDIYPLLVLKRQ